MDLGVFWAPCAYGGRLTYPRLPDLEGFLKFASIPDGQRVALTLPHVSANQRSKRAPAAATAHAAG
jgi:hypothetical protein